MEIERLGDPGADPWRAFTHDPRESAHAPLRAADRDRDVVRAVLSAAYGDGRLDREEHDERLDATAQARTLGDLPALISDLVPEQGPRQRVLSQAEIHQAALTRWEEQRRRALLGFLGPSLLCWAVWLGTGHDYFPWPLIITILTLMRLLSTVANRRELVHAEVQRLEKKQARALKRKFRW